ncbi:protein rolling stone-like isoform X1 [Anneissia japonica]|uniref:protein rolling stone-like isoform X1 n=1 Tax=Anneissia japonica TaxID=1529436 RepID=UPI00142596AB|nr:protein rolling stone-like isoform X1 [Anneissia japonica]
MACYKKCLHSLGLTTSQRGIVFTKSQFPGLNPYIFSIYRFVVTLYFIVIFVWYTISSAEEYGWTYCIYLTNWTLILVTVYLLVASFNSAVFLIRWSRHDDIISSGYSNVENALPFVYKLQWVLYNMAASGSVLVAVIYWGAVYSPGFVSLFTDLNVHAFTSLAMIIETLLSATPVRLLHVVYPIAYAISYLVLTLMFWAADGTDINGNSYIYSIIDYEKEPGFSTITVFGALIGVIVCHVLIWLLVKLRLKIVKKWFNTMDTPNVETDDRVVGTSGV